MLGIVCVHGKSIMQTFSFHGKIFSNPQRKSFSTKLVKLAHFYTVSHEKSGPIKYNFHLLRKLDTQRYPQWQENFLLHMSIWTVSKDRTPLNFNGSLHNDTLIQMEHNAGENHPSMLKHKYFIFPTVAQLVKNV